MKPDTMTDWLVWQLICKGMERLDAETVVYNLIGENNGLKAIAKDRPTTMPEATRASALRQARAAATAWTHKNRPGHYSLGML